MYYYYYFPEHATKWFRKTCGAHMLDRVDGNEASHNSNEKKEDWYIAVMGGFQNTGNT
jgi:hypothetical protein